MTSIFEGQPPKTRSFPIKTRFIWNPGIYDWYQHLGSPFFLGGFFRPGRCGLGWQCRGKSGIIAAAEIAEQRSWNACSSRHLPSEPFVPWIWGCSSNRWRSFVTFDVFNDIFLKWTKLQRLQPYNLSCVPQVLGALKSKWGFTKPLGRNAAFFLWILERHLERHFLKGQKCWWKKSCNQLRLVVLSMFIHVYPIILKGFYTSQGPRISSIIGSGSGESFVGCHGWLAC